MNVHYLVPTQAPQHLTIATRESRLALWQAEHIRQRLAQHYPHCHIELLGMSTRGDQILDRPLAHIGGKGLFIKELESALLEGRADIAVHSMKDVPMLLSDEFTLAAICARDLPCDAFISNKYASLEDMPPGAIIGTSSLRREAQLRAQFPYLAISPLRGNLDTRLAKLDRGEYDAIVLAEAGLTRLGLADRIRMRLPVELSLPAPGQGAIAIETKTDKPAITAWLSFLNDPETSACVRAERALSKAMTGSCDVPLGAYAKMRNGQIWLRGFIGTPDGLRSIHAEATGDPAQPEILGLQLAAQLHSQGAEEILAAL